MATLTRHLLVTNDFPPKVGGIQSYLYELWRRLDPESFCVVTTPYPGAAKFDAAQPFRVVRVSDRVLIARRGLARQINELCDSFGADLVVLDPLAPLGGIAPLLTRPYAIVTHGAEVTVPARLSPIRTRMSSVLSGARLVIAAGAFPASESERVASCELPICEVPPGVDTERFVPLDSEGRRAARGEYGIDDAAPVIVSVSRLVPRKGMDVLIKASSRLAGEFPGLQVLIGGTGRDHRRLARLIATHNAPVRLVGRVDDDDLPAFLAMADVFAMCCRNRWGGIEQEGFGIVFLEAAACGVPQVAGLSGGSADAVDHENTGLIVREPSSPGAVTSALRRLLIDADLRGEYGDAARRRAVSAFDYNLLAQQLGSAIENACTGRE